MPSQFPQSSILIFEMAWKMSRDNVHMAWFAAIGAAERLVMSKIDASVSLLETGTMQQHISRLTHNRSRGVDRQPSTVYLTYNKEWVVNFNWPVIPLFYLHKTSLLQVDSINRLILVVFLSLCLSPIIMFFCLCCFCAGTLLICFSCFVISCH